jgi:hypothetical protein
VQREEEYWVYQFDIDLWETVRDLGEFNIKKLEAMHEEFLEK